MTITLNGFSINDPTVNNGSRGIWIDPSGQLTGLEMPSIRSSTGNYAGRDGGYVGAQFFSPRDISIPIKAFGSTTADLALLRQELQAALLGDAVTVNIVDNAGNSYTVNANLIDFTMPISNSLFSAAGKIELLAPDPTIYGNEEAVVPVNIARVSAGGFTLPMTLPLVMPGASAPTSITNAGSVPVYPIITMTGVANNPVITNDTTGTFFGLNLTTGATDEIAINMQQKTVTLNGSNVFGDLSAGSTWWALLAGGNLISLNSSNGGDTVSATITWQSGYIGI